MQFDSSGVGGDQRGRTMATTTDDVAPTQRQLHDDMTTSAKDKDSPQHHDYITHTATLTVTDTITDPGPLSTARPPPVSRIHGHNAIAILWV